MEGIEESQINDRDILEATHVARQDHSGRIQFRTKLPSGRDLNSEWIQESDKTKAMVLWVEAVRGQIAQDSNEAAAKARRTLKELRAAQPAVPRLLGADGLAMGSSGSSTPAALLPQLQTAATPASPAVPVSGIDPSQYVRVQYTTAAAREAELSEQVKQLNAELSMVRQQKAQWFGILTAMGVSLGAEQSQSGSASAGSSGGALGGIRGSVVVSSNQADAVADTDDDGDSAV